jgi:ribonuclease P protein component
MLSQSHRIPRHAFPQKNTKISIWSGGVLRIRSYKGELQTPHFALILSKKTYATKPERNLFKRRVFALIQKHLHKFPQDSCDYILLFPLIHTQNISFREIQKDIESYIVSIQKK